MPLRCGSSCPSNSNCASESCRRCGVFEAGMHSVHHLTEADAAKCAIAAVSSHSGGLVASMAAVERPADVVTATVPAQVVALAPSRLSAPDLGRAPPAA